MGNRPARCEEKKKKTRRGLVTRIFYVSLEEKEERDKTIVKLSGERGGSLDRTKLFIIRKGGKGERITIKGG